MVPLNSQVQLHQRSDLSYIQALKTGLHKHVFCDRLGSLSLSLNDSPTEVHDVSLYVAVYKVHEYVELFVVTDLLTTIRIVPTTNIIF
jgi:hypothetical protein